MNSVEKVNYHSVDQRFNLSEINDHLLDASDTQAILNNSRSVACLVNSNSIKYFKKEKCYKPSLNVKTLGEIHQLDSKEKFFQEKSIGFGTAFLIGKHHILSTAHNVYDIQSRQLDKIRIEKTRVVFDFYLRSGKKNHLFQKMMSIALKV